MSDDAFEVPIEGTLDLHAFQPRDIPSVVDEYLRAAHAAGFHEVRLIHVASFADAPESHLGATTVTLHP
jgi:hypothetical protein